MLYASIGFKETGSQKGAERRGPSCVGKFFAKFSAVFLFVKAPNICNAPTPEPKTIRHRRDHRKPFQRPRRAKRRAGDPPLHVVNNNNNNKNNNNITNTPSTAVHLAIDYKGQPDCSNGRQP